MSKITESFKNVYGFRIVEKNGENHIYSPKMKLPVFVKERINFFAKYLKDGMTSEGCFNLILSEDEEKAKKEFEIGAYEDYLPASEEFKQWRDEPFMQSPRQMEIAVAIIYGMGEDSDE